MLSDEINRFKLNSLKHYNEKKNGLSKYMYLHILKYNHTGTVKTDIGTYKNISQWLFI